MYKFKRKVTNKLGKVFHPGMVVPENIPPFAIAEMVRVGDVEEIVEVEEEIQPIIEEVEEWQDIPVEEIEADFEEIQAEEPIQEITEETSTPRQGRKKKGDK
jgi:hypothetical protein